MKKFIQISSLLSLLVLFATVSASAQKAYKTEVELPFAFSVADKSYDAGKYVFKISKDLSGSATLTVANDENKVLQMIFMQVNGDRTANDIKLVFDNIGGKRYLKNIRSYDYTFALNKSKEYRLELAKAKKTDRIVAGGN